ncbi:hypothetical protein GCK72_022387 [Caenorhabditis remanei]|uniref:Sdz-33 F-box domain-containing protein n=1 Tax=Caenorhabditis remanei TaxID=31234 RepID=A0A6A5FTV7_CAERE|nr:hypothetical protein GCK72_022387 [Caenorhabditis remanei]KAF1745939.1 hypothetical protein GCK72_022387 [Caenorhabditis remanei]
MPDRVIAMRDDDNRRIMAQYQNPGLSIQQWLANFLYIFSRTEIWYLKFARETCKFDMSSLMETIGTATVNAFYFYDECGIECVRMALRQFPDTKIVFVYSRNLDDPSRYKDILIQNLDGLILGCRSALTRIEHDDILIINSKEIVVGSGIITDKIINRFLKHWKEGSNPRMERAIFLILDRQHHYRNAIFKGLNFHEAPFDQTRHFTHFSGEILEVVGGYDIRRVDGSVLTVIFEQGNNDVFGLTFYVWG